METRHETRTDRMSASITGVKATRFNVDTIGRSAVPLGCEPSHSGRSSDFESDIEAVANDVSAVVACNVRSLIRHSIDVKSQADRWSDDLSCMCMDRCHITSCEPIVPMRGLDRISWSTSNLPWSLRRRQATYQLTLITIVDRRHPRTHRRSYKSVTIVHSR
jgi:hypothetical protein